MSRKAKNLIAIILMAMGTIFLIHSFYFKDRIIQARNAKSAHLMNSLSGNKKIPENGQVEQTPLFRKNPETIESVVLF